MHIYRERLIYMFVKKNVYSIILLTAHKYQMFSFFSHRIGTKSRKKYSNMIQRLQKHETKIHIREGRKVKAFKCKPILLYMHFVFVYLHVYNWHINYLETHTGRYHL